MPDSALPFSSPAEQGVDPQGILTFIDAIERTVRHLHSFILVRHGAIVAQGWWKPYAPATPHLLFSLTKSFTSTAIGMAIQEGLFTLDDAVTSFFPDDVPADPQPNLAAMKVRHLLSMSTGHDADTHRPFTAGHAPDEGRRNFFSQAIPHAPGTHFLYNTGASQMLAEIIHRRTGQTMREFLTPRLFGPLGITPASWDHAASGTNTGGTGLSLTTDDIARFGQFLLQKGHWHGRRLVPAEWIATASQKHISNGSDPQSDWQQGYGFQFWRCRHGAFRGDGAFGQYCVVMPEQDAVLAMNGGMGDMQAPLTALWDHLLPAMGAQRSADAAADRALEARLAGLTLPTLEGRPTGPAAVNGRVYRFADEPPQRLRTLSFTFDNGVCTARMQDARGTHIAPLAFGAWANAESPDAGGTERLTGGNYAWTDENTLTGCVWLRLTPFGHTFTCRFAGDECHLESRINVAFSPIEPTRAVGRAEA